MWAGIGLGFLVGTLSTHFFWFALNRLRRHCHKWVVISVFCDGEFHYIDPGKDQPYGHYLSTNVVSKCECGELRRTTVPGRHTLEALRGEDSEIQRVLKKLREMRESQNGG